eukprot:COSAG04_NODE_954_length_9193_cov_9.021113_9_plen_94_part_00
MAFKIAKLLRDQSTEHNSIFSFESEEEFTVWMEVLAEIMSDPDSPGCRELFAKIQRKWAIGPCSQQLSGTVGGTSKTLCVHTHRAGLVRAARR